MNRKFWTRLALTAGGCLLATANMNAQSKTDPVEIMDKNGQSVPSTIVIEQELDQEGETGVARATAQGGVSVRNDNGTITITDANGQEQTLQIPGAQSVTVTQSAKTVVKDGQQQTENFGKAIIIGPDGKRQEIIFTPDGSNAAALPGAMLLSKAAGGKFMIGVNCSPLPESLTSQLELEAGVGLMIESVVDDSPASTAGLKKHDILMYADDAALKSQDDLVAAVERAGSESKPLSLTLVRAGKEISIETTPAERPADQIGRLNLQIPGQEGELALFLNALHGQENLQADWQQAGPGMIVGPAFPHGEFQKQMEAQMEEMRAQMEEMKKKFEEQNGDQQ